MIVIIFLSASLGALSIYCFDLRKRNTRLRAKVQRAESLIVRRQGYLVGFGHYDIRSFDDGKNWYSIKENKEGVHILGKTNEVMPGLIQQINGFRNLQNFVLEHGSLSLSKSEDLKVLREAGFSSRSENGQS
jgi:hypothetical protein